jgi:nucleoporin NUP82
MLATYESIDLGLVKGLNELTSNRDMTPLTELLQANHPIFLLDPLHDDRVYVYHAFGVHALDIAPVLENLSAALREENEDESVLKKALEKETMTNVRPILSTFSIERKFVDLFSSLTSSHGLPFF